MSVLDNQFVLTVVATRDEKNRPRYFYDGRPPSQRGAPNCHAFAPYRWLLTGKRAPRGSALNAITAYMHEKGYPEGEITQCYLVRWICFCCCFRTLLCFSHLIFLSLSLYQFHFSWITRSLGWLQLLKAASETSMAEPLWAACEKPWSRSAKSVKNRSKLTNHLHLHLHPLLHHRRLHRRRVLLAARRRMPWLDLRCPTLTRLAPALIRPCRLLLVPPWTCREPQSHAHKLQLKNSNSCSAPATDNGVYLIIVQVSFMHLIIFFSCFVALCSLFCPIRKLFAVFSRFVLSHAALLWHELANCSFVRSNCWLVEKSSDCQLLSEISMPLDRIKHQTQAPPWIEIVCTLTDTEHIHAPFQFFDKKFHKFFIFMQRWCGTFDSSTIAFRHTLNLLVKSYSSDWQNFQQCFRCKTDRPLATFCYNLLCFYEKFC